MAVGESTIKREVARAQPTQPSSDLQMAKSTYDLELFDNNPVILVRWTPELNPPEICINYISKNIQQLGFRVEEILSGEVQWTENIHPDDLRETLSIVDAAAKSSLSHYQMQYRFRMKSGAYRWIQDNATIVRSEEGSVLAFQSALIDITDMKQVELELKRKSSYLQGLYETSLKLDNQLDLQQTLDLLLQRLVQLSDNDHTYIILADKQEDELEYVAGTGLYQKVLGFKQSNTAGINGAVWQAKEAIFCHDYQKSKYWVNTTGIFHTIKSIGTLPLISSGEVIGVIGFATEEVRHFDEITIELLNSFAKLAAVTLDNLNLHSKVKGELVRNQSLFAISEAVHDSDRLDSLMDNIVEHVRRALGARWAIMYEIDTAKAIVENVSTTLKEEEKDVLKILNYEELNQGLGGWAIHNKKAALSLKGETGFREADSVTEKIFENNMGSVLVVPFLFQGKVQGTIAVINHVDDRNFDQQDVELINSIANQVGVAVAKSKLNHRIEHLAFHDSLTKLPNRTLFELTVEKVLARAKRQKQTFAIVFIDLDGFKYVNDTCGHDIGDKLLEQVAEKFKTRIRAEDTLARMGGDEFALVLSDLKSDADAIDIAESYLEMLQSEFVIRGHTIRVGASIGISCYPDNGQDFKTLLKNADSAMYQAKNSGKNSVRLFTESLAQLAKERMDLETDLKYALDRGELELYYQPQYSLQSGECIGVEAVLRWHHATRGTIPPSDFIPIAEESNLIVDIGTWVLNEACQQNATWQAYGYAPITMAVNISAKQFDRDDFVEVVIQALQDSGLRSEYLELEVTESVVMHDINKVIERLTLLRQLNITIAIDDFGTGYSSLQYLQDLPLDKLKIDKSFIDKVTTSSDSPLVKTILMLSQNLNLKTVAEGIETQEQLNVLRQLGCDEVQGFYFSKPLKAANVYVPVDNVPVDNQVASKSQNHYAS